MKTGISVCLTEAEQARAFTEAAEHFQSDIDLISGRYIVNAKSMLGVLSLVSDHVMEVRIHSGDEDEIEAFCRAMRTFEARRDAQTEEAAAGSNADWKGENDGISNQYRNV